MIIEIEKSRYQKCKFSGTVLVDEIQEWPTAIPGFQLLKVRVWRYLPINQCLGGYVLRTFAGFVEKLCIQFGVS